MAQTPLTSLTPFLTAARLWRYKDPRPVLELLNDDDTTATKTSAEDGTTAAGAALAAALGRGSGDIEAYAVAGGKYLPADLAAIVAGGGNGAARVEGLAADLAFWHLTCRRYPGVKPEDVAGVTQAMDDLQKLRDGITIFGTQESVDAGNESVTTLDPGDDRRTVRAASRMLGNREPRGVGGRG